MERWRKLDTTSALIIVGVLAVFAAVIVLLLH